MVYRSGKLKQIVILHVYVVLPLLFQYSDTFILNKRYQISKVYQLKVIQ